MYILNCLSGAVFQTLRYPTQTIYLHTVQFDCSKYIVSFMFGKNSLDLCFTKIGWEWEKVPSSVYNYKIYSLVVIVIVNVRCQRYQYLDLYSIQSI